MKSNFFISLILLTISTIIIIFSGCGSGDDITHPSSITTGIPVNNNGQTGSIIIRIKWPEAGIDGNCILSSGDGEETLMASMPGDTKSIHVEVFETGSRINPLGEDTFWRNLDPNEVTVGRFDNLPLIRVDIRATAYDYNNNLIPGDAIVEGFQIKFGINTVDLLLGDYGLNLKASDPFVVPEKDSLDASAGLSQPEVDRMLNWFVERDILDSSGEPPGIINRDIEINANLNITTDPSVPVSGREVTFSLIDPPSDVYLSSTTATTDDNGNCKVTLTTVVPNSPITVEGVFKVEWEDPPGTPVVKEYKDRITINPNIRNILLATKDNDLINIPDFFCDYFESEFHDSTIRATLKQIDSENYVYPHPTIDGKTIKFTVKDTACSFSPELTFTGAGGVPGEAVSNLNTTSLAFRPIKVTIECLEDPSDPNFILPAPQELTVIVSDNLVFEEDFEKAEYEPGLGTTEFHNVLLAANGWGLSLPLETPLDFIRPEFDIIPYVSIQPRRKPV